MPDQQYVFIKDKPTNQVHIYKAKIDEYGYIHPARKSECEMRESKNGVYDRREKNSQGDIEVYNEAEAREHCPVYGRPLCGVCVSTLYSDVK